MTGAAAMAGRADSFGVTVVTTVRFGGASAGRSAAETSFASRFDVWKKRGMTSPRFSGVMTFASSTRLVRWRRPSRSSSTISG